MQIVNHLTCMRIISGDQAYISFQDTVRAEAEICLWVEVVGAKTEGPRIPSGGETTHIVRHTRDEDG